MQYGSLEKGARLSESRLASQVTAAAGVFLFSAVPALCPAQSFPPGVAQAPHTTAHTARPMAAPGPADDFEGLTYTDDQQAKIRLIRQNGKLRRDAVVKDQKLSPEQREAMLQGLQRIERGQVYKVLTPQQQTEVRKRIIARQMAARSEQEKTRQPSPR